MRELDDSDSHSRRIAVHPVLGQRAETLIHITVDGQQLEAVAGEPIAATLLAHGHITARTMPESGATRGLFCGVGRCADCLMIVDGVLNVRTCITPVHEGARVETQRGLGTWDRPT